MAERSRYIVKSLEKAFSVIELFDAKAEELSATEIARRLGTTLKDTFRWRRSLRDSRDYLGRWYMQRNLNGKMLI